MDTLVQGWKMLRPLSMIVAQLKIHNSTFKII
jgi:hypothetical protein